MRELRRAARGYTLVALIIGMTIMLVLIAAILPLESSQQQREREAELIFRGRQYGEGIRAFRRKYGRFPNSLKEMLDTKPRTVRKLWKDPITNSNDWGIVTLGTSTPIGPTGSTGSTSGGNNPFGPKPTATPAPTPTPSAFGGSGKGGGSGTPGAPGSGVDTPLMPVMGVYSKSAKKAFRIYQGRDVYNEWRSTWDNLNQDENGEVVTPGGLPGPGGR